MSRRARILPPLVVVLLLFAAAFAGRSSRAAGSGSAPVLNVTNCSPSVQSGGTESTYVIHSPARYIQPIAADAPLGHVTLDVIEDYPYGTTGVLNLVEWDPIDLVPDPTTVVLRTRTFQASQVLTDGLQLELFPPVVLQSVDGVAEPPRTTIAIDYRMTAQWYPYEPQYLFWSPDGSPATPLAYDFTTGTAQPLPGPHGVLGHSLCAAAGVAQERVCQSVVRCDTVPPASAANAIVQRFRVPQRTEIARVELAFGPVGTTSAVGTVAILDAQDAVAPPTDPTGALVTANLGGVTPGIWGTHFDFDHIAVLEPGHDYWLWVTTADFYSFYLRRRTGAESAAFTSGIGELWRRGTAAGPWSTLDGYALAFRLIGTPYVVVAVDPREVAPTSLRLSAAPNPSAAASTIRWAGARGAVHFDVFDPTGRRVASASNTGAEGVWTWRNARDVRSAGVFFVRATDASGRRASLRVTLVP